jgi:hypothetical protein
MRTGDEHLGKNFVYRKKFGYKHGLLKQASKQASKQRLLAYRWPRRISRIRRKRIISETSAGLRKGRRLICKGAP